MNRRSSLVALFGVISALGLCWAFSRAIPRASADERAEIDRLAQLMQWKPGAIIADIGAGDGAFSFAAAEKVGPSGRVYATEIDPEKLKSLRAEVEKHKLQNVIIIDKRHRRHQTPHQLLRRYFPSPRLSSPHPASRIRQKSPSFSKARRPSRNNRFRPTDKYGPVPGVPKNRGGHGIPQKIMIEELTAAGLQVEKIIDSWQGQDYCVIFTKPLS